MWNKLKNWVKNFLNPKEKISQDYIEWKLKYGTQLDARSTNILDKIVNDILNGGN